MAITPKECNPELQFLHSACCLILINICVKFHENISNGYRVMEQTRFRDRQTDYGNQWQKQYASLTFQARGSGGIRRLDQFLSNNFVTQFSNVF